MEGKVKEHTDRIIIIEKRQQKLEIQITEMSGNVTHIKERIDNGMSATITKVYDKLVEIAPVVSDNQDICGRVKAFAFWISVMGIGGGLISFMFHMLRNVGA